MVSFPHRWTVGVQRSRCYLQSAGTLALCQRFLITCLSSLHRKLPMRKLCDLVCLLPKWMGQSKAPWQEALGLV